MSLQVYEQLEWHGIARRGPDDADPNTSHVEVNTVPGLNELKRMEARKPFMAELGAPAFEFIDPGVHWKLYGAGGSLPNFSYSGSSYKACVCFKTGDSKEVGVDSYQFLLGAGNGLTWTTDVAWALLYYPSSRRVDWYYGFAGAYQVAFPTLSFNTWYWIEVGHSAGASTGYSKVWVNGNSTVFYSASWGGLSRGSSTANFALTIGSDDAGNYSLSGAAVAYAACGSSVPSAWCAVAAESGTTTPAVTFRPQDARKTVIPATLNDATNKYCWQLAPRPELDETSLISSPFVAKGIRSSGGKKYIADLSDKVLLQDKTVFMFCYKSLGETYLFRSYDSQFMIGFEAKWGTADSYFMMRYPIYTGYTYSPIEIESTADLVSNQVRWLAVEFNPGNSSTAQAVITYQWTTGAWVSVPLTGTGNYGGFPAIDFSKCTLLETANKTAELYDFRVIVGDSGWQTTHTATASFSTVPNGLVAWLNNDSSGAYPRDVFTTVSTLSECGDFFQHKIAIGDRVDGTYRYTIDQGGPIIGVTGCPYLKNAGYAQIEDIWVNGAGSAIGMSDFYWFEGTSIRPAVMPAGRGRRQLAPLGDSAYVTGAAPLSFTHRRVHPVGQSRLEVHPDVSVTTTDWKGSLAWSTAYHYKVTIYDPITGNESNPYGPFKSTTGSAPTSTTAPAYGTAGCSLKIRMYVRGNIDIRGQELRIYRKHQGTGTYHFETACSLSRYYLFGYAYYGYDEYVTLALSEDSLQQQVTPELDNNAPPIHSYAFLWNKRAWYVDAINPTRIWYSKTDRYGAVPGANCILTDEGVGGKILGCKVGLGGLILLRERSIWIVPEFSDDASAYAQALISDIGCVSDSAMCFGEGIIWWASANGIYAWDGASQPVPYSYKLKGLDLTVWAANPRGLRAYYDRANYRAVFVCDGSGIAIDSRTGAACLVSAPESYAADAASSEYSGPVYGQGGGVFREVADVNGCFSLSTAQTFSSANAGPLITDTLVPLYQYWHDGSTARSGTAIAGWEIPDLNATAYGWLTATSQVGRCLTMVDDDYETIWTRPIAGVGKTSTATSYALVRTDRSTLQNYCIDRIPVYYRSQDLYLGSLRDVRMYELLDFLTGDIGATATADMAFSAFKSGDTNEQYSTARASVAANSDYQMAIRSRGNRCYYTLKSASPATLANIRSVRIHFQPLRPRAV